MSTTKTRRSLSLLAAFAVAAGALALPAATSATQAAPAFGLAATTERAPSLVDLDATWEVGEAGYESRSENCCFAGQTLRWRVLATVAAGAVAYRERAFALSAA